VPLIVALPETSQTTGAREGWLMNVTVLPEAMFTDVYRNTTAHLSGSYTPWPGLWFVPFHVPVVASERSITVFESVGLNAPSDPSAPGTTMSARAGTTNPMAARHNTPANNASF
jgi:hypothetical protein